MGCILIVGFGAGIGLFIGLGLLLGKRRLCSLSSGHGKLLGLGLSAAFLLWRLLGNSLPFNRLICSRLPVGRLCVWRLFVGFQLNGNSLRNMLHCRLLYSNLLNRLRCNMICKQIVGRLFDRLCRSDLFSFWSHFWLPLHNRFSLKDDLLHRANRLRGFHQIVVFIVHVLDSPTKVSKRPTALAKRPAHLHVKDESFQNFKNRWDLLYNGPNGPITGSNIYPGGSHVNNGSSLCILQGKKHHCNCELSSHGVP